MTIALSSIAAKAYVSSLRLGVTPVSQEKTNWCWAASALMIGNNLSYSNYSQSDIVKYIKGSADVNKYGSVLELANAIEYVTDNKYNALSRYPFTLTFEQFQHTISNWKPVASLVQGNGTGHFYVVYGYNADTNSLYIIDPSGGKKLTVDYYDFHYGDLENGWKDSRTHTGDVVIKGWCD